MAQPQIFLSHSSKDAAFTSRLETDLRTAGAKVHIVSAQDGGNFVKRINDALAACEWVVLVLSANALASPWVDSEMTAAIRLAQQGSIRTILPIQAGPVDYRTLPPLLGNYNIFDATRDYAAARDAILRTVGLSPATAPNPLPPCLGGKGPHGDGDTVGARPVSPAVLSAPAGTRDDSVLPRQLASLSGFAGYRKGNVAYIVPPVVAVPAGEFLMGSDPKRDSVAAKESWAEREQPQRKVNLPAYQFARFPLTVAEYACFVRSGHAEPKSQYNSLTWKAQLDGRLDHPAVNVSWNDVVAYAAWLAKLTGQPWRLPSEAEWEKAARGTDGRIYSWGDAFDKARCNTSEGGKGTTTPVGSYPSGASPCGAQDIAGNVWEWTSSLFKPYPYISTDGRENVNSTENRVLRGGSWVYGSWNARAACRNRHRPDLANGNDGARLVCAVPNS